MSRLPLRIRVTAAFAVAMAVVLAVCGMLVYVLVARDLADSLDRDLQQRAQDLATLVATRPGSLARVGGVGTIDHGESFAELLDATGRVVDATSTLGTTTLLRIDQLRAAEHGQVFADVPAAPGLEEPARLLAVPVERGGRSFVLVVGETRQNRAEALRSLRTELFIFGPVALVLATGLGYLLAGSGLRAVERMRRRAEAISADNAGERLSVPKTGDELKRLGTTLNEMLARLDAAFERERKLERAPFAAWELLESVRNRFLGRAESEGRSLVVDDPDELRLEGDELRLRQALGYLVDNALRYGGGQVRLQAISVGGAVELHVRDEGSGLPADVLSHPFERGRGLEIVSVVAQAHGGTAGVRNDGHLGGADVWVSIPGVVA